MTDDPRGPRELDPVLDEELSALVDGELPPVRAAALWARVEREPRLAERLAAFEQVDAALRAIPERPLALQLEAGLRDRIARAQHAPAETPGRDAPRRPARRRLALAAGLAAAASLALAVLIELRPPRATPERLVTELEAASEEEIAVALAAEETLGDPRAGAIESAQDLAIVEELEFVERLEAILESGQG